MKTSLAMDGGLRASENEGMCSALSHVALQPATQLSDLTLSIW